jgi:DNA replication and repair protein RecF
MARIEKLSLTAFRCIDQADLLPSPGFNIITGLNAQGKTTVLEGIHVVSTGRLLRSSRESSAIQEGKDSSRVAAELAESGTLVEMRLVRGQRKRAYLNTASLPRASDLLGRLPSVAFSARDLEIVRSDPSSRRSFMDAELAQISPAYLKSLTHYKRALEQRSALLRRAREGFVDDSEFVIWEGPLCEHGEVLRRMRHEWVDGLIEAAAESHAFLGAGEDLVLAYETKSDDASMEGFASTRREDIARGRTGCGPHRDDLSIMVGGLDARQFGSQGQQRTAVIALKLSVLNSAKEAFGFAPLLLLDDVFSDLDSGRRSRLVEHAVTQGGQVFLTCTEPEQAGSDLLGVSKVFRVSSGQVEAL